MKTVEQRFLEKVDKNALNGCWEWTARTINGNYGMFHFEGNDVLAHRFSYEFSKVRYRKGFTYVMNAIILDV